MFSNIRTICSDSLFVFFARDQDERERLRMMLVDAELYFLSFVVAHIRGRARPSVQRPLAPVFKCRNLVTLALLICTGPDPVNLPPSLPRLFTVLSTGINKFPRHKPLSSTVRTYFWEHDAFNIGMKIRTSTYRLQQNLNHICLLSTVMSGSR